MGDTEEKTKNRPQIPKLKADSEGCGGGGWRTTDIGCHGVSWRTSEDSEGCGGGWRTADSGCHGGSWRTSADSEGCGGGWRTTDSEYRGGGGGWRTPRSHTRDSGYATDNSPATFHSKSHFTFDTPSHQLQHAGAVGGTTNDSVSESFSSVDIYLGEDDDEGDDSAFLDNAISDNLLDSQDVDLLQVERYRPRSGAFLHALPDPRDLLCDRGGIPIPLILPGGHRIRPLGLSRTVGTQTPHLHCVLIRQLMSQDSMVVSTTRGTVHQRLRRYSEGEEYPDEQAQSGPLPDIISTIRDRSISLPDVQSIQRQREVEVGRELRRISDEFHLSYHRRHLLSAVQENFEGEASSFPGARRPSINKMMDKLRLFLWGPTSGEDPDTEDPPGPT